MISVISMAPQLTFRGDCRKAFEFYATLLGGKITVMTTFGENDDEVPAGSVAGAPGEVRFAEMSFGNSALRGNDVPASSFELMQGFHVSLHTKSIDEARHIFNGLADGGHVAAPLIKVAWAELSGTVVDRFGVPWMILALNEESRRR